jgi:hypothetical protein
MIFALQCSTLLVCALLAALRAPAALRGENRSLFSIFVLAAFAMLLSIGPSYTLIDSWLGGSNYANLLLRFVIYGTVLLAGYKIARGFDNRPGVWLLLGPVGLAALAIVAAATVLPFLMANTAGTSVGMASLPDQSEPNRQLIRLYTAAGRLYPAFVAACLLPATLGAIRSRLPRLVRLGAAVLSLGAAAMIVLAFGELLPPPLTFLQYFISSTAVLGLTAGLALIWLGKVTARRAARKRRRAVENHMVDHEPLGRKEI